MSHAISYFPEATAGDKRSQLTYGISPVPRERSLTDAPVPRRDAQLVSAIPSTRPKQAFVTLLGARAEQLRGREPDSEQRLRSLDQAARGNKLAAVALMAAMEGPRVTDQLLSLAADPTVDDDVRVAAVRAVLDDLTGGWDDYGLGGERIALPPSLRARLAALPPFGDLDLAAVLTMFA